MVNNNGSCCCWKLFSQQNVCLPDWIILNISRSWCCQVLCQAWFTKIIISNACINARGKPSYQELLIWVEPRKNPVIMMAASVSCCYIWNREYYVVNWRADPCCAGVVWKLDVRWLWVRIRNRLITCRHCRFIISILKLQLITRCNFNRIKLYDNLWHKIIMSFYE